ncbi:MAG: rhodanese-like domain-containing protein, partial [Rhizobiales bacterium]|nr:rhodanese-like domain-containing protein [Hyphomicrobiales bacterium]
YSSDIITKDTPLVFYCNSPLEYRSAMASFFAVKWGYTNVSYFREGYFSWMAADFPLEYDLAFLNQYQ